MNREALVVAVMWGEIKHVFIFMWTQPLFSVSLLCFHLQHTLFTVSLCDMTPAALSHDLKQLSLSFGKVELIPHNTVKKAVILKLKALWIAISQTLISSALKFLYMTWFFCVNCLLSLLAVKY